MELSIVFGFFIGLFILILIIQLVIYIQDKWNKPKIEIKNLKSQINELENKLQNYDSDIQKLYDVTCENDNLKNEINVKQTEIEKLKNNFNEFTDIKIKEIAYKNSELQKEIDTLVDLSSLFDNSLNKRAALTEILNSLSKSDNINTAKEIILLKNRIEFLESTHSNLTAIPYMSQIMADYETYGIEKLAKELDWGQNVQRLSKVKSIREIRKDAQNIVEKNKDAQYQLAYLFTLYPALKDVIECDFNQLPLIKVDELKEYDTTKDYLTEDEYNNLSTTERNQLALDRYKNSHNKSKWQIGRDYELYIGYRYYIKGYSIDYFGSYMGLEDLGRDIIATKDNVTLIIQCKYWSSKKLIHEKHITQLYGTVASYCIENNLKQKDVKGLFITNIELSDTAKKMAKFLKIDYKENVPKGDYPCIKCNIGHNEFGITKIYHLPFDQKYDVTQIKNEGEFFAMTVAEAEQAGFRRAFKWFGNN